MKEAGKEFWELAIPDFPSEEDPDEKGFAVRIHYGEADAGGRQKTMELRLAGDVGRDDPLWPMLRATALRMFAAQTMYAALETFVRRRENGQEITLGDLDRAARAMREADGEHLQFNRVPFPPGPGHAPREEEPDGPGGP